MPNGDWIRFKCIELRQPIGSFYIGAVPSAALVKISYADVRRIQERDIEVLSGIQRPLSQKRVKELQKYVQNVDASFPTGIILAVSSEDAQFDETTQTMSLRNADNVAQIIDGQHRIAGLIGYQRDDFMLNVTLFIDMDKEDQAMLFATINLKQTVVSKSLAYDLFEFAETRSPQKTCHNIAMLLNSRSGSPFEKRIMVLGKATGAANETLTQAAFIDPLIKYISEDPMTDRDKIKRDIPIPECQPQEIRVRRLIFRNMFVNDRDAEIAKVLWNYFAAVAKRWPDAWEPKQQGRILNRTTGYRALIRFLPNAYLSAQKLDTVLPQTFFDEIFQRVRLTADEFTPELFKPGSGGQADLYDRFVQDTQLPENSAWIGIRSTRS